jgi:hypothetical protein
MVPAMALLPFRCNSSNKSRPNYKMAVAMGRFRIGIRIEIG